MVGNSGSTMKIANDKYMTKKCLLEAGVSVPKAEVLIKGVNEKPSFEYLQNLKFPCIVKPACEDNSLGVKLVQKKEDLSRAIDNAFDLGEKI